MHTFTDPHCLSRSDSIVSIVVPALHRSTPSSTHKPVLDLLESLPLQNPFTPPSSPSPCVTTAQVRRDDANDASKIRQVEFESSTNVRTTRADNGLQPQLMDTPPTTPEEVKAASSSATSLSNLSAGPTSPDTPSSAVSTVAAALDLHAALGVSVAAQQDSNKCEDTPSSENTTLIFGEHLSDPAATKVDASSFSNDPLLEASPATSLLFSRLNPLLPSPAFATNDDSRPQVTDSEVSIVLNPFQSDMCNSDYAPTMTRTVPQTAFVPPSSLSTDQQFETHLVARVLTLHDYHRYDWMSIAEPLRCYWGVQVSSARILKILQDWGRVRTTDWWD